MSGAMKPKADPKPKRQVAEPATEAATRRRLQQLLEQLAERPELLAQIEALVSVVTSARSGGPAQSAEQVEERLVEATRRLGQQSMAQWAQEAQARAVAECQRAQPKATVKKKAR
jgi:hypothetical protein